MRRLSQDSGFLQSAKEVKDIKTCQLQNDGGNKNYKNYNCQKTWNFLIVEHLMFAHHCFVKNIVMTVEVGFVFSWLLGVGDV